MATLPEQSGCWLNRGSVIGIIIRDDVRTAAVAVWAVACRKTRIATGDDAETASLMESAVAQTSQYLNNLGVGSASANVRAVLMRIFRRLLHRYAMSFQRLEPAGREMEFKATVPSWEDDVNTLLILEQLQQRMSRDGVIILTARRDGHSWQEIAQMLQTTVSAVKKRFWRDIEDAKVSLKIGPQKKPAKRAKAQCRDQGSAA